MINILVYGGWFGTKNIGDEAILLGISTVFRRINPNVNITAFTADPEYTTRICNVNAIRGDKINIKERLQVFYKSDIFLISGGTPLYDYEHQKIITMYLIPRILEKKVILFGISSRRINTRIGKFVTRLIVSQSDFITVREPETVRILRNVGIRKKIRVTGDSALIVEPTSEDIVENILNQKLSLDNEITIGICPRYLSSTKFRKHYHDKISDKEIANIKLAIAKVADYFIEKNCNVIFIPFHTEHFDDDMKVIRDIVTLMKSSKFQILDIADLTPPDILGVIGKMDIIIGLRLHSLIFAASQCVPMVTIDYDTKIRGFMKLIGLENFICEPLDDPDRLINKVEIALLNREKIEQNLKKIVDSIRKDILDSAKEVIRIIDRE